MMKMNREVMIKYFERDIRHLLGSDEKLQEEVLEKIRNLSYEELLYLYEVCQLKKVRKNETLQKSID
mgnify:FL=1